MTPDPFLPAGDGHTPISPDELEGLIPTYITTRGELYEAEQANIVKAIARRAPKLETLLDHVYLRDLHRAMFSDVWEWAGRDRTLPTNPGIDPVLIGASLTDLVADTAVWVSGSEPVDRVAVRFHHRLVWIHPFPNGNGRHARQAADLLLMAVGAEPFSWGAGLDVSTDELRQLYLRALRRVDADREDLDELQAFGRT